MSIVKYLDLPPEALWQFHEGSNVESYKLLGAHLIEHEGISGIRFTVYAPNAKEVRVIGDFNGWNGEKYKLWKYTDQGIWSIFIEGLGEYTLYKYEIVTSDLRVLHKTDPYGYFTELKPKNASLSYNLSAYEWHDNDWLRSREMKNHMSEPISIYEVNFASWRKKHGDYYSFSDLTKELITYVKSIGFTHIEIMPITEYPYDGSWGYQQTGYYAISSRFGTPNEFKYFVDTCHQEGLGVIMDWVPCHYPKDSHGLCYFDGGAVYESQDGAKAYNPQWDTMNFDYSKPEVRSFLISNVMFLLSEFHIDGIRVDAVAYMIYEHMSTGGTSNVVSDSAVGFIKQLNQAVKTHHKGVLMIAEESSAYPHVTEDVKHGGLGFDFKWNMGWMNDTLEYFKMDPVYRKHAHDKITFSMAYAFSEHFMLPLSHDEVVHGKMSLLNKMPGYYEDKFASLKLLYTYMFTFPGKKLLFMGGEFGHYIEWNEWTELDWHLLEYESHKGILDFVTRLNTLYRSESALYEIEKSWEGFEWLDSENRDESVFIYKRMNLKKEEIFVALNFTPIERNGYWVKVEEKGMYEVILNTDDEAYWGSGRGTKMVLEPVNGVLIVDLPPLSALLIKKVKKEDMHE